MVAVPVEVAEVMAVSALVYKISGRRSGVGGLALSLQFQLVLTLPVDLRLNACEPLQHRVWKYRG